MNGQDKMIGGELSFTGARHRRMQPVVEMQPGPLSPGSQTRFTRLGELRLSACSFSLGKNFRRRPKKYPRKLSKNVVLGTQESGNSGRERLPIRSSRPRTHRAWWMGSYCEYQNRFK